MKKDVSKSLVTRVREFQQDLIDSGIEIQRDIEGYGYNYADLPKVISIISPYLKKHGIWYIHRTSFSIELKCNIVTTYIYNVDDEADLIKSDSLIDPEATLGGMNRFQVEGSAITYFRRYHLTTLLGLVTEEDTDAGGKRKEKTPGKSEHGGGKPAPTPTSSTAPNFVDTFTKLIEKGRPVASIRKTLDMYKDQISNEDLKKINQAIKEYENKS